MAVKPAAGEVLVEEKRTRLELPNNQTDKDQRGKLMPIWEYVDTVPTGDWQNGDYEFTIYRGRSSQKSDEKTWIGKFHEKISPEIIQSRWGGGEYNVWLKCPPGFQLRYNVDLKIEGAPKISTDPIGSGPASMDATSQLIALFRDEMRAMREEMKAARGGDLGMEAVKQAMSLNGQVFTSAVPAVTAAITGGANGGHREANPMDELTKQLMQAMIAKMLNPADPIEQFSKMASAMGSLGYKMGGNPQGGIAVELARGLVNALPQLASHVSGIMGQYVRAEEAKLKQVQLMRGTPGTHVITQPAAPPRVHPSGGLQVEPAPASATAVAPPSNVIEMPAAAADAPADVTVMSPEQTMQAEQIFQFVETKVVELLLNTEITPEEAANDALTFIDVTDKRLVDELLRHGEGGLRWAFANRPILQQVPQGPRLDAFISEFVKNGRKSAAPNPLSPDPNIPPA